MQVSASLLALYMCPHTAAKVSFFCCVCVLFLLHVCPETATYLASANCCIGGEGERDL